MLDYSDITPVSAEAYDFENCFTRLNPGVQLNERDLVAAMYKTHGCMAQMGRLLGRRASGLKAYMSNKPQLQAILNEIRPDLLDRLEYGLFESALAGDSTDRRFVLQTLGRNRGYVTRGEVAGPDGGAIPIAIDLADVSVDELADVARAIAILERASGDRTGPEEVPASGDVRSGGVEGTGASDPA